MRIGFVVAVLGLLAVALVDQGPTLRHEVRELSAPVMVLAFLATLAALMCSLMVWRSVLADLGSPLPLDDAFRIMFIGQLAKYIPGSLWPVLGQMELAADRGVPRARTGVSVLLSSGLMVCTGGVVGAATVPFVAAGSATRYLWLLVVVPIGMTVLSPPVLNRILNVLLRVLRRSTLQQGVSVRGLAVAGGWAILSWAFNGAMTYALLGRLAGHGGDILLLSVGAYALSWVAGFLAIFAPAGAGVREAVMVAIVGTHTSTGVALTVTLVSRGFAVVADAVAGAAAGALIGHRHLQALRANIESDSDAARGDGSGGPDGSVRAEGGPYPPPGDQA